MIPVTNARRLVSLETIGLSMTNIYIPVCMKIFTKNLIRKHHTHTLIHIYNKNISLMPSSYKLHFSTHIATLPLIIIMNRAQEICQ